MNDDNNYNYKKYNFITFFKLCQTKFKIFQLFSARVRYINEIDKPNTAIGAV